MAGLLALQRVLLAHLSGLSGFGNQHQATPRTRDRATNRKQISLAIHHLDPQVLRSHSTIAHMSRPTHPFEYPPGRTARTDGPHCALSVGLPASPRPTSEAVPFHRTGKASSLRDTHHIDPLAGIEQADVEHLPHLVLIYVVGADLSQVSQRRAIAQVACLWAIQSLCLSKANLNGIVAVGGLGLDLGHIAWARLKHRNPDDFASLVEELGHSYLFPD